jgi:hypothetical protein
MMVTAALTLIAVAVQGYHPYAEDGGLYLSEIKKIIDPTLYPSWSNFVTAQVRFSLFAPMVASVVRGLHLSLMTTMPLVYVASIWATLIATWMIALRCFRSTSACLGATSLLALWLTLPIAGTSLMLMDPYVTARSISTPCGLFALAAAIDVCECLRTGAALRKGTLVILVGGIIAAEMMHPLMATYELGCIVLVISLSVATGRWRILSVLALCAFAVFIAAVVYWLAPPASREYIRVAQTRTYWFIDLWHWYELLGLFAPLILLGAIPRVLPKLTSDLPRSLGQAFIAAGLTGIAIATAFSREASSSYSVARLQPLRIFQMVYIVMLILLGGALAELILRRKVWRWVVFSFIAGCGMLVCQLQTYPSSAHVELPWSTPKNEWEQGFIWIKSHTSRSALFALDSNYITAIGEDSQNFRAIAERSTLPDYSKDGGLAAIAPELADGWVSGHAIDARLDRSSDLQRTAKLNSAGVKWVVLSSGAITNFNCPYSNRVMKVCQTPLR